MDLLKVFCHHCHIYGCEWKNSLKILVNKNIPRRKSQFEQIFFLIFIRSKYWGPIGLWLLTSAEQSKFWIFFMQFTCYGFKPWIYSGNQWITWKIYLQLLFYYFEDLEVFLSWVIDLSPRSGICVLALCYWLSKSWRD